MRFGKLVVAVVAAGSVVGAWQALKAENARPRVPQHHEVKPDPYLWLTKIRGPKALAWVQLQNAKSDAVLKDDPVYAKDNATILSMLNAKDRIAAPFLDHDWVFNFWQDKAHIRGVWRRAQIAGYNSGHPHWQTLLDFDKLDTESGKDWVWKGAQCAPALDRCLVELSPGGGDAVAIREFDLKSRKFLTHGFRLPVAKSVAVYLDDNTILFATDFGPGSMTPSSYPRVVKLWHRGEPIRKARTLFEARPNDMIASPMVFQGPSGTIALIVRQPSFFKSDYYAVAANGGTRRIDVPEDAELGGASRGQLIFTLQSPWAVDGKTIAAGALIAYPMPGFDKTGAAPQPSVLFTPGPHQMINSVAAGRDAVYASIYTDVVGTVHAFHDDGGAWKDTTLDLPKDGSTEIVSTNDWGGQAYLVYENFLDPPTLYFDDGKHHVKAIQSLPARFDASKYAVVQHWVASRDGTRVPYFLIGPKDARGPIPTILYGYGGFQVSLTPWYWNDPGMPLDVGRVWLEKGGAIAVANIRGGGAFGPAWHLAAIKMHRQRAFDDFEAVAADIEKHNWSTPKMLGIVGASNGGLLVSTAMVERPDLFGAVVCQRPLTDMLRYTEYGAGASWEAEYGNPANPKVAAYLRSYSPYQNVKAGVRYPPVLFITETSDDRVTPVFGRMMAARMEGQGHDVLFNEAAEGGHGAGATHAEVSRYWALSFTFLQKELGLKHTALANAGLSDPPKTAR